MPVTPDDVLQFKSPTDVFLCPLSANKYDIDFTSFTISNYETKSTLFHVGKNSLPEGLEVDHEYCSALNEESFRKIKYTFSEDVLRLPLIATSLTFQVGQYALPNFRMIERHYFKSKLVKSYDFNFGFCIPGSTNTWEAVYDVPPLDETIIREMIDRPYETTSDSFYFVGDELVMHNKAGYRYVPEDHHDQEKKSDEVARDLERCQINGSA